MKNVEYSLGWELEATRGVEFIPEMVEVGNDGSVRGDGLEYRLKKEAVYSPQVAIKALKELLKDRKLRVDYSCGFHVHMGLKNNKQMTPNTPSLWAAWCVTLGKSIEENAFYAVPDSRANNSYCKRWKGVSVDDGIIKNVYQNSKYSNDKRYQWINVVEMFRIGGIKTVEIRLMGDSRRYTYLFSWLAFCILLGQSAYRLTHDPSLLDNETNKLNHILTKIRLGVKCGSNFESAKTTRELILLAGIEKSAYTKFLEFSESEYYLRKEIEQSSKPDWSKFHASRLNEETGQRYSPRSPVRGCHCELCENKRSLRAMRRAQTMSMVTVESHDSTVASTSELEVF